MYRSVTPLHSMIDVMAIRQTDLLSEIFGNANVSLFLALGPPKLSRGLTEQMTEMTC
jgi:hypothetical protein